MFLENLVHRINYFQNTAILTKKVDWWYFFHEWKEWKIMQINFSGQNFSKKIFMDVFLKRFMSGFSTFCKKGAFFTMDIPFGYIENVFSYLFKMPMSKCFLPINFFPVTFSHIYSFWWSMLILPCQCNLGNLFCCLLPSIQVLLLSFQVHPNTQWSDPIHFTQ